MVQIKEERIMFSITPQFRNIKNTSRALSSNILNTRQYLEISGSEIQYANR